MTLPQVQMFWHGPALSRIERLSLHSFLAAGHPVRLHVYDDVANVPAGVTLADANRIVPRAELFRHAATGSIAPFADWFRYRLLHAEGGLWCDTDVVCLAPLDYGTPEVFGWQDESVINNAVLALPPGHALTAWMADVCERPNRILPYDDRRMRRRKWQRRFRRGDPRTHVLWGEGGPLGFTQAARYLGYSDRALPFWHFYPVHYANWLTVFDASLAGNPHFLGTSRALHLWNERTRHHPGFVKDGPFDPASLFERLWRRYVLRSPAPAQ